MNEIPEVRKPRKRIDPRMIIGAIAGLYGASPIDIIPDVIPVLGVADDAGVIALALVMVMLMTFTDWE